MNVVQLTNAIVGGINSGLEQFLEGTLAAMLPVIWLVLLGLHLGRPYILDMIERFTLRLGADLLWLIYVGLRDFLIISGVVMSFMFLFPDVVSADQLPHHRRIGRSVFVCSAAGQIDGRPRSRLASISHCDRYTSPRCLALLRALRLRCSAQFRRNGWTIRKHQ